MSARLRRDGLVYQRAHTHTQPLTSPEEQVPFLAARAPRFKMLQTIAIGASGDVMPVSISMDPSWMVTATHSDGAVSHLSLSCLFPWGENAIYLFGSLDRTAGPPVDSLPSPVSEVLIFPPMVPLKHQVEGFQALSPEEWDALVATQLSDRPPTCASAPLQSFKRRMVTRSSVDEEVQSLLPESDDESSDGAESAPLAVIPVDDDEDLQSEPESYGSATSF